MTLEDLQQQVIIFHRFFITQNHLNKRMNKVFQNKCSDSFSKMMTIMNNL